METKDKQLIAKYEGYCGTCKYLNSSLRKPTESTNTWETWFDSERDGCLRYPPVFVGGDKDAMTEDGCFCATNWQSPVVNAFSEGCGEYVRALWVPGA